MGNGSICDKHQTRRREVVSHRCVGNTSNSSVRFRKDEVAITADIEGMFHQFYVAEAYRDFLRFLWWKNDDVEQEIVEYRMKVHIFGATSSPGCANFGLKRAADEGESEFGSDVAKFIRRDFYVDDGITATPDSQSAISLINRSRRLCAKAGLRLHKFTSNSREVLASISVEDRTSDLQAMDLNKVQLPLQRVLGIMWNIENDAFCFRMQIKDVPLTRRGMLSTVSYIYDPLCFVGPVLLEGKRIVQQLCKKGADWDDPVPNDLRYRWERWRNELQDIENLKINRFLHPVQFGTVLQREIHHFSDASNVGCGQCSYIRLLNGEDLS
ncbi:uncharacterized protein LOC144749987 [Ciona intestinalis]